MTSSIDGEIDMNSEESELKTALTREDYLWLDFYQREVDELPPDIFKATDTDIISLRLGRNRLTTLPDSIGYLTNLCELRLHSNQIRTLPASIANLQQLTWLSLSFNRLTSFPESITYLTNLTGLRLNGNQLVMLPESLVRLTNLTFIDLSGNPLVDLSILQRLPKLKKVRFWNIDLPRKYWIDWKSTASALQLNSDGLEKIVELQIAALPESFSLPVDLPTPAPVAENLGFFESLMSFFQIDTTEPVGLVSPPVNRIDLRNKQIIKLPELVEHYLNCDRLDLSNNKLASLPLAIGKLTRISHLELHNNLLTSLPGSIGNLAKLIYLDLRRNHLNYLPASIDNLSNLTYLYLSGNYLRTLPCGIGELSKLTHLHLDGNLLTSLPESVAELSKLTELKIGHNQLRDLPTQLENMRSLTSLDLAQNQFTSLPTQIGSLHNLTSLNLRDNQLKDLPVQFGNLRSLTSLDLSLNQFTNLPTQIGLLHNLTSLDLSHNPLTDLSILQNLSKLNTVRFIVWNLPRRYWTKLDEWKAEWLLDEQNTDLRRRLIQRIGYERICDELNAIVIDVWREYTLLQIDNIERFYDWRRSKHVSEPMVLLKMTCPSTKHIHVLRVPPETTSAEAAITWVNHGIHPDNFAEQT
jgi:leucine-rich repeat protein SHOC2